MRIPQKILARKEKMPRLQALKPHGVSIEVAQEEASKRAD